MTSDKITGILEICFIICYDCIHHKYMLWFKMYVVPLPASVIVQKMYFHVSTPCHSSSHLRHVWTVHTCARARVSCTELQLPLERHVPIFKRQIACSFKWHKGMNSKAFYCLLHSEGAQSNDQAEGTKIWLKSDARQMQAPCLL